MERRESEAERLPSNRGEVSHDREHFRFPDPDLNRWEGERDVPRRGPLQSEGSSTIHQSKGERVGRRCGADDLDMNRPQGNRLTVCGESELEQWEPAPREDVRHEGIFRDEEGTCGWADGEIARVCLPVPRGRVDRRDDRPGSVREPLRLGLDPGPARRRGRGGSLDPTVPIP